MREEIKEILYVLKHIVIGRASRLTPREANKLLDYITNLQEENIKLKELCDKYEEEHKTTFEYWKHLIKEDYKARNEKAIEYINKLNNYRFEFTFDNVDRHEIVGCEKNFVKDLLNILKGDNK